MCASVDMQNQMHFNADDDELKHTHTHPQKCQSQFEYERIFCEYSAKNYIFRFAKRQYVCMCVSGMCVCVLSVIELAFVWPRPTITYQSIKSILSVGLEQKKRTQTKWVGKANI